MAFYNDIAKYYDLIFPTSQVTIDFLKNSIHGTGKEVLDVACGTGGYSLALEREGFSVTALDLDKNMVEALRTKSHSTGSGVRAVEGNILDIGEKFEKHHFNMVFCIGNSLVHLNSSMEIKQFFEDVRKILKPDGTLVFQIINYDRIIAKKLNSLPTIYNEEAGLSFERLYRYEEKENKIYFKTILTVEDENFENEVPLYALKYNDAVEILKEAGFNHIEAYGDFKGSTFDKDNSYAMVISCKVKSKITEEDRKN